MKANTQVVRIVSAWFNFRILGWFRAPAVFQRQRLAIMTNYDKDLPPLRELRTRMQGTAESLDLVEASITKAVRIAQATPRNTLVWWDRASHDLLHANSSHLASLLIEQATEMSFRG